MSSDARTVCDMWLVLEAMDEEEEEKNGSSASAVHGASSVASEQVT